MKKLYYVLAAISTLFVVLVSGREAGAQATTGLIIGQITDSTDAAQQSALCLLSLCPVERPAPRPPQD